MRIHLIEKSVYTVASNGSKLERIIENTKIKRFMANRYPELLEEFQELATMESL